MVERKSWSLFFAHLTLFLGSAIILFPIYLVFVASSHEAADLVGRTPAWFGSSFGNNLRLTLTQGFESAVGVPVSTMLFNSLVMALGVSIGKIALALLAAFSFVYCRFPGRIICFWLVFVTLMLPIEVRIVPTYTVIANLNLLNSPAGLIFPLMASAMGVFMYRQFFLTVSDELLEAALIDGAGPWRFFKDIAWPLSRNNTAALFVVLFIYGWNQFLWPLLITTQEEMYTIVMSITRMSRVVDSAVHWNIVMMTAVLAMLPPLLVVVCMQRMFVKGMFDTDK
jgi:ABC-type sugar transport system, permease component